MPIVSKAQMGAMYAAKEGKSTLGIPASVGADFVAAGPASSKLPEHVKRHERRQARRAALRAGHVHPQTHAEFEHFGS